MTLKEYDEKVYNEIISYIEKELKEAEIEYTKQYREDYGLVYELPKVGELGKIQILLESNNECRRSSKSDIVDILSFFCHFYEYHNETNLFDNRFNIRSGKYNLHTMSSDYNKFINDVKRVINIIVMNSNNNE